MDSVPAQLCSLTNRNALRIGIETKWVHSYGTRVQRRARKGKANGSNRRCIAAIHKDVKPHDASKEVLVCNGVWGGDPGFLAA